jgi:Asp-tRNA(Asn)/Glu-tRNA(Gln) amidotransferase A subunit family amidase
MADDPWRGDTCSLVDAFRSGDRSPAEELEASLAAIERSELNAFTFIDAEGALAAASRADVAKPFGGVPLGIKELHRFAGWPDTDASLVFRGRVATYTSTMVERVVSQGGCVPLGLTSASEFGGLNVSVTRLNGVTGNGWDPSRSAGGSSGGSASAVAGGLVTIATGGDGGGSIRIPAGFNGLVGMKGTVGRISRGPHLRPGPMTVVPGCLARSVRDVSRWFDVTAGSDPRDPYTLPDAGPWESRLGTYDVAGRRVAIMPDLGRAIVRPEVADAVRTAARSLATDAGLTVVDDVALDLPRLGLAWAMANLATLLAELGDRWPECRDDLTEQMAFGLEMAVEGFDLEMAARCENSRMKAFEAMAQVFDQVDFVICATNPDVAYPAQITVNTRVGHEKVGIENNGVLTIPANICGNPAVSIPVGSFEGLPIGMQIIGRHHEDALLLDLARIVERERPWPLTSPGAPL